MTISDYESRRGPPPPLPERPGKRGSHYTGSSKDTGSHRYESTVVSSRHDPYEQPSYDSSCRTSSSTIRSTHSDEPCISSRYVPSSIDHPSAYEFEYKVASDRRPHEKSSRHESSSSRRRPDLNVDTSSRQYEPQRSVNLALARAQEHYNDSGRFNFSSDIFTHFERRSPGPFGRKASERQSELRFETDEERARRRRIFGDH